MAMMQFLPASITLCPNCLADDILTFSNSVLSMLSLKLLPSGCETLMQIRVLFGCGTANMELTLNLGSGGLSNGPATNFFVIHVAMVSVTDAPNSKDFFEFFTMGPMGLFWNAGPPVSKYSKHLTALSSSDLRSFLLFFSTNFLNLDVLIFVSGFDGMLLNGNRFQKSREPFPPYFSSFGMSGFFRWLSVLAASGVVAADDVTKSQNMTIDHFVGRPRSALEAGEGTPRLGVQPL
jgi:hypothetical protein